MKDNAADLLTKAFAKDRHQSLTTKIGVVSSTLRVPSTQQTKTRASASMVQIPSTLVAECSPKARK